jgi:hypothetical protein
MKRQINLWYKCPAVDNPQTPTYQHHRCQLNNTELGGHMGRHACFLLRVEWQTPVRKIWLQLKQRCRLQIEQ